MSSSTTGGAVHHARLVSNVTATVERSRADIMAGFMKSESGFKIETVRVKFILTVVFFCLQFVQHTSGKRL